MRQGMLRFLNESTTPAIKGAYVRPLANLDGQDTCTKGTKILMRNVTTIPLATQPLLDLSELNNHFVGKQIIEKMRDLGIISSQYPYGYNPEYTDLVLNILNIFSQRPALTAFVMCDDLLNKRFSPNITALEQ